MELRENNLTSRSLINKEGYLCIREDINKDFQMRWFVLKDKSLFYFERHGITNPIDVIALEGCNIGNVIL